MELGQKVLSRPTCPSDPSTSCRTWDAEQSGGPPSQKQAFPQGARPFKVRVDVSVRSVPCHRGRGTRDKGAVYPSGRIHERGRWHFRRVTSATCSRRDSRRTFLSLTDTPLAYATRQQAEPGGPTPK